MDNLLSFMSVVNLHYIRGQLVLLIPAIAFLLVRRRHLSLGHRLFFNNAVLVLSFALPIISAMTPVLMIRPVAPAVIMPVVSVTSGIDAGLAAPQAMSTYPILGILGLAGLLVLAFRLVLQIRLELRLRRTAAIRRRPGRTQVCSCADITAPFSSGLLGTAIYLPLSLRNRQPDLGMILRHEANHVRGFHFLWLLVQTIHRSLFWFNPLAHLLASGGELDREHCCDSAVVRTSSPTAYARMLVDQAKSTIASRQPVLTSSLGRKSLKSRITFLMEGSMHRTSMLSVAVAIPAVLVSVLILSGLSCRSGILSPTAPVEEGIEDTLPEAIQDSNPDPEPSPAPAQQPKEPTPPPPASSSGSGSSHEGQRSRESIMTVVMENLSGLRYLYNQHLRETPGLQGKVAVKFSIDQDGKVLSCEVVESTTGNAEFDQAIADRIKTWQFGYIDEPGDVTTVVYPLIFSQ